MLRNQNPCKQSIQTPSLPIVSIAYHDHSYIMHKKIQIIHSRSVLRAHFALTQVLLLILYPLTSNSSLYLVPLNQHPVFAVIFNSNCCWQNPLKVGYNPLLTVKSPIVVELWSIVRSCMNLLFPLSGHI